VPPLSTIDADIENSRQTAASLASRRKELQRSISENLRKGADRPARDAAAELHALNDEIAFEEQRGRALLERRAAIEAEAASEKLAAQWVEVDALLAERSAAAETIEKAIRAVGKGADKLMELGRTIDQKLAVMPVKGAGIVAGEAPTDEVRSGIVYSLIGAGLPWIYPSGREARVDGNRLADRISRNRVAVEALKEREAA